MRIFHSGRIFEYIVLLCPCLKSVTTLPKLSSGSEGKAFPKPLLASPAAFCFQQLCFPQEKLHLCSGFSLRVLGCQLLYRLLVFLGSNKETRFGHGAIVCSHFFPSFLAPRCRKSILLVMSPNTSDIIILIYSMANLMQCFQMF